MILWLRLSNLLLFLATCALLATGLALEFRIEVEDEGMTLLGLNGEAWGELHFILGLSVAGLILIHLALNWAWIKGLVSHFSWLTFACLGVGLGLFAVVLLAPVSGHRLHGVGENAWIEDD